MDSSDSSDGEFVAICFAAEEIEKQQRRFWIHDINLKREMYGEFHHLFPDLLKDEQKFFQYFRMSANKFYELLDLLPLTKQCNNYRQPIGNSERLAVTLKYLGHGDSFVSLSFSYRMGESTIREIVYETCQLIWEKLSPTVMPEPTTEQWEKIEREFSEKWDFPNCIGAIDGKHVVTEKPSNSGSLYFNYKKDFSVVLLALVDADMRFITVDVGAFGRNSDGGIFRSSGLGKKFFSGKLSIPTPKALPKDENIILPHVIVGDEAFPLTENLMRPYAKDDLRNNANRKIYNYRHSRARRVSENAFGIFAKKFRIFSRKCNVTPEHLDIIILAATCLHNFLRNDACSWQPGELEATEVVVGLQDLRHVGGNREEEAQYIRDGFAHYFSTAGAVSWQQEIISRGRKENLPTN